MKDDPESKMNDVSSEDRTYSPKRRRTESNSNRLLPVMIVVLLVLIFAGGIYYVITRGPAESDATLQSKFVSLEERIAGLEKQITDLQEKLGTVGPDPALLQRVDALAQKVEALEKHRAAEPKVNLSARSKSEVPLEEQYHTVQKGETLYQISKKYGISVEELRKLNNLSADQPIRIGQKLVVSSGH